MKMSRELRMANPGQQPPPRRKRPSAADGAVGASRPDPGHSEAAEFRLPLPWVIGGAVMLSLLMAGGMIGTFVAGRGFTTGPESVTAGDASQSPATEQNNVEVDQSVLDSVEKPAEPPPTPEPAPVPGNDDADQVTAKVEPLTVPVAPEPEETPLPLSDIIDVHKEHLPLPPTEQNRGLSGGGSSALTEVAQLAKIYVDDPAKVTLRIEGQEAILPTGVQFAITEGLSPDRSMKSWTIAETNPTGVAAVGTPVGQFRLRDHEFSFQWQQNLQSTKLQFCRLIIEAENSAGTQKANCTLFEPYEQAPLTFDFENIVHTIDLNLDPRSLPHLEQLRMEVAIAGIDHSQYSITGRPLTLADPDDPSAGIAVDFFDPASRGRPGDRRVRTEIRLVADVVRRPSLIVQNLAFVGDIKFDVLEQGEFPPDVLYGQRAEPIEFCRRDESKVRRDCVKALRDLKKHRSQLQDVIAEWNRKYSSLAGAKTANTQAIRQAGEKLKEAQELKKQYALAEAVATGIDDRLAEVRKIHQELEQEVQIDFRLYLVLDGTQVDILRTRSLAASF